GGGGCRDGSNSRRVRETSARRGIRLGRSLNTGQSDHAQEAPLVSIVPREGDPWLGAQTLDLAAGLSLLGPQSARCVFSATKCPGPLARPPALAPPAASGADAGSHTRWPRRCRASTRLQTSRTDSAPLPTQQPSPPSFPRRRGTGHCTSA